MLSQKSIYGASPFLFTILCISFSGCSLKPKDLVSVSLTFQSGIRSIVKNRDYDFSEKIFSAFNPPDTISGFKCLAVNIVGSGIPSSQPDSDDIEKKVSDLLGGAMCSYPGITSLPIQTGQDVNLKLNVPSGRNRIIQVVGLGDTNGVFCNSSTEVGKVSANFKQDDSFYELGRKVVDLFSNQSVSIDNSYDKLAVADKSKSKMACGSGPQPSPPPPLFLKPDGTDLHGKIYSRVNSVTQACIVNSDTAPAVGAGDPILNPATPVNYLVEVPSYTPLASENGSCTSAGNCLFTECKIPGGGVPNTGITYFTWDLSSIDISQYKTLYFYWSGEEGHYSGACDGANTVLDYGTSSNPNLHKLQIFLPAFGSWSDLTSTKKTYSIITSSSSPLSSYLYSGSQIWLRIVADGPSSYPYCSSVQTDMAYLTLYP